MTTTYLEPTYRALMVNSIEEALFHVQWYSKKDIQEVLADYMVARHYDFALNAIIRKHETLHPILYRGSRFKKDLLVKGAMIDFGQNMISTSLDINIASRFAADDYLPEGIYADCAEFGIVDGDDANFKEKVDALYGNVLFEIHNGTGLYLNSLFDVKHNFSKEQEVLIEHRDEQYQIVSVEPYIFKIEDYEGITEYNLTKVVVHTI